jgi:hypothetical protein
MSQGLLEKAGLVRRRDDKKPRLQFKNQPSLQGEEDEDDEDDD